MNNILKVMFASFFVFLLMLGGCAKQPDPVSQVQLDANKTNGKDTARMNALSWMAENLPECSSGNCTVAGDVDSYVGFNGCPGGDGWSEWKVKQLKKNDAGTVIGSQEIVILQCRTFNSTGCYTKADADSGNKKDYIKNKCNPAVPAQIAKEH